MNLITKNLSIAEDVTASLRDIYRELEHVSDLRPGPRVDDLFGRLVRLVLTTPGDHVPGILSDPVVRSLAPRLRDLCARGEGELEFFWARLIGESHDAYADLARFPYLENYRLLSRMEADAITAVVERPIRSVAFAGSGPLPLSSLFLARQLRVPVDNLDYDAEAVAVSRRLAERLGLDHLRIHQVDVMDADLSGYDVVILAALVGSNLTEKAALLDRLASSMTPGAVLLIRSAHGMRTLLYPEVALEALDGFDVLTVIHPTGEVINSAIVARPRCITVMPGPRTGTEE